MPITDLQQSEIQKLGDKPVEAALNKHRNNLKETSEKALKKLDDSLTTDEATIDQVIKIYDTTRKHLNTIDGRADTNQQNIIIIPAEFAQKEQEAIEAEVIEQLQSTPKETPKEISKKQK